ncbi:MAG TPA: hypothetical protein VFY12_00115 [Arenimonas sp.]|nr:hypothetical protein [Arenimonas sp.]
MQEANFLEYRQHRYLKLAVALALVAAFAYAWHQPPVLAYGGTWLGYTLGTVSALLVLLLLWLGVRKRQYRRAPGTLQGWLSAHVYLGTTLLVLATLHSGFELGWNVHSLAYALMLGVILSGFYGVAVFLRLPGRITVNMGEDSLDSLLLQIADLDREARRVAMQLPDAINSEVLHASERTKIGGSWWRQLRGNQLRCPTAAVLALLQRPAPQYDAAQSAAHRALYALMLRKQALVNRARRDVMYKARLQFWLYLHVPLSFALLLALLAHVLAVFYYW